MRLGRGCRDGCAKATASPTWHFQGWLWELWSIRIGMSQWGQLGQVQAEVNKYKGKGVFQL